MPPPTAAPASVFSGATDTLYIYGGMMLVEELGYWMLETSNRLYALDVDTREWRLLSPAGERPPPSEKGTGWEYGGDLWIFGGYSHHTVPRVTEDSHEVAEDPQSDGGWSNSLVCYSPGDHRYLTPQTRGRAPCPRAGSASCVSGHQAGPIFIYS